MNPPNPAMARPGLPGAGQRSELWQALQPLRPYFVRSAWFTVIATLLTLASTGYMLEVYDRVVNSRSHTTLLMLTLLVLFVWLVMELLEWAHSTEMHHAGLVFDEATNARVFRLSFEANLRRVPGGTAQTLNDLRTIREIFKSPVITAIMESPVSIVFLVLIFAISPVLGWVSVAVAVLQLLIALLNERSTQPPLTAANRSAIEAQQSADASLRNAQVIEAMGMLRNVHKRWFAKQREFLNRQALASDRAGVYSSLSKFLQQVTGSALLGLSTWLFMHGALNGGSSMMIISSILGGMMLKPLVQVVMQWRNLVNARDAWRRLSALMAALPARGDAMPLPAPRGAVVAEGLIAAAPTTQATILRGVSFALNPGEVLAVIGPSAAGKTTLARVMAGLWPSLGGKARLDGVDMFTWDKAELGQHVGYLPQDVELFDGSIADNIARFGEVDMKQVHEATRAVGLHEFIESLPEGYDTDVGPEGARLSGGQRQRIGLARALYGHPVFVLLDEPNSSLDETGDAVLNRAIQQYKAQGTTFIVITHRTSLLQVVDKILLLRDGQVQAFGPRDDVLAALQKAQQAAAQPAAQAVSAPLAKPAAQGNGAPQ